MNELKEIVSETYADKVLRVIELTVKNVLSDPQMLSSLLTTSQQVKTLGELSSDYKKYLKEFGYSKNYLTSMTASLNKAEFVFGLEKKIHEINTKQIEGYIQFCKSKAPAGWKVDYRNIRTFFSKMVSYGYLQESPCKKINLPKEQIKRREYLTLIEIQEVLLFIRLQVLKDIYLFAFYTALRLSELLNLRWKDVSINDGIITVGSESFLTKSRKIRTIPLSNEAVEILKRRFPKLINPVNDFVFTKKDGKKIFQ